MHSADTFSLPESGWPRREAQPSLYRQLVLEQYDREWTALLRYLRSIGVEQGNAEELVQESFLRLHQHLLNGGDRSNLRAWLYRVAHNLACNMHQSAQMGRTGQLEIVPDGAEPASTLISAEAALIEREQNQKLHEAMERLSASQRGCLSLRSQGLKYREIGDVLNLSVSTVAEHIRRALESLKESL